MSGVYFVSLGCPKNLVDTEVLAGILLNHGRNITFDAKDADVYLINTCAFLPSAREEAFEEIRKALNWKKRARKQSRRIAVAGCLPQYGKDNPFREKFPEVDFWLGVNDIPRIIEILDNGNGNTTDNPSYLYEHNTPRLQLTVPHMAYLKIADGCNNCCSYCAIPHIRGKLRTRTQASVVAEAQNLIANGVKELVIVAQDVTVFGHDRPESGESLSSLLRELDKLDGEFKLRLLYTHPAHYTDELIETLKNSKHVMHYLDMPLQHISERILKAMNRHVTQARVKEVIRQLREAMPDLVLRTTFITGFPGETVAEFEELKDFIKEMRFERCGVFPYSAEPGTKAAEMADQIDFEISYSRADELMDIQTNIMEEYQNSLIGREIEVIADDVEGTRAIGRGVADAPEIDNIVVFGGRKMKAGKFYKVRIEAVSDYDLIGHVTETEKKK
ncbi:MAG: 30S ribosomal protein S12 methylthiotransferase RimO [Lentisphaeria bacterium]|nr:30S ribosomal protein S12 methylthiotransferase RimO [Lentisphaeria bacterium]